MKFAEGFAESTLASDEENNDSSDENVDKRKYDIKSCILLLIPFWSRNNYVLLPYAIV